jgi:hypothetical protein
LLTISRSLCNELFNSRIEAYQYIPQTFSSLSIQVMMFNACSIFNRLIDALTTQLTVPTTGRGAAGTVYGALDTTTFEETESEICNLGVAWTALKVRLNARFPSPASNEAAAILFIEELAAVVACPAVDARDFKAGTDTR